MIAEKLAKQNGSRQDGDGVARSHRSSFTELKVKKNALKRFSARVDETTACTGPLLKLPFIESGTAMKTNRPLPRI